MIEKYIVDHFYFQTVYYVFYTRDVQNYVHFSNVKPDELINKRWSHQCVIYQQWIEQPKIKI